MEVFVVFYFLDVLMKITATTEMLLQVLFPHTSQTAANWALPLNPKGTAEGSFMS